MKYSIVLGTVFGDEGKGLVVDNLCSYEPNSLVVRFSGGHNAGHTVMDGKTKHVFSSFGSGTLLGCPSFYTEDTCISLTHMYNELRVLNEKGYEPKLYVHPLTNLTTPFDIMANRSLEVDRGIDNRHGSCGAGIGQTMKRNLESPFKLYAIDLTNKSLLMQKLKNIQKLYYNLSDYQAQSAEGYEQFMELLDKPLPFRLVENYQEMVGWHKIKQVVFEGSQGILLDMDHGIFPNVTYANTTSKNAWKYILHTENIHKYYVTRCYQTRHGNGWMSNQDKPVELINNKEEINICNAWQGDFRKTEMDWDLVTAGIVYDMIYNPKNTGIKSNLVVTCLDQRPDFNNYPERIINAFEKNGRLLTNHGPERGNLKYG